MKFKSTLTGLLAATMLASAGAAQAETLRLLTWGSYAPDELVKKFEANIPTSPSR
jgi:spermidine/putrescine transport system substrate-binding protein